MVTPLRSRENVMSEGGSMVRASRITTVFAVLWLGAGPAVAQERPRAREAGLVVGIFPTGEHNAITDVDGVLVGHSTVIEGETIRTGVTAIIPAPGDLYREPVPGWIHQGNGYGKLIGETQVREFGEIETPILLVCTLCVWNAAEALADYLLHRPGEAQHTINPIVGEVNDSRVNDMWADPITYEHVAAALDNAASGPVAEGSVGGGTGSQAFGWKGGIGTSSRVIPEELGGYTVGILVQTNFGGVLTMNGAPVGRELGNYPYSRLLEGEAGDSGGGDEAPGTSVEALAAPAADEASTGLEGGAELSPHDGGSIMMVLATDAPLTPITLERLSRRVIMGLARTGSYASNGSGDYVISFSTAPEVRRVRSNREPWPGESLLNAQMSPLFLAAAEATEEAIYNAMFKATTITSARGTLEAIPLEETLEVLRKYNALNWDQLRPHGR
jgi:D-aminopeptidase